MEFRKNKSPIGQWKQIGLIQGNINLEYYGNNRKCQKFEAQNCSKLKKDSSQKIFRVQSLSNQKSKSCKRLSTEHNHSQLKNISNLQSKRQDGFKSALGFSIIGKINMTNITQRSNHQSGPYSHRNDKHSNDHIKEISEMKRSWRNNTHNKSKLFQVQQQFYRFRQEVIQQLKFMESQMNHVIHQVLNLFRQQVQKFKSTFENNKSHLIDVTKLSPIMSDMIAYSQAISSKINDDKSLSKKHSEKQFALAQNNPLNSYTTVKSDKFINPNSILNQNQIKKFAQAISRLKKQLQPEDKVSARLQPQSQLQSNYTINVKLQSNK